MNWTIDRVAALKTEEICQLRANAYKLRENEVVALCDEILATRPKRKVGSRAKREPKHRALVSRKEAFERRGVKLKNFRWSWGGIRPSDGAIVFTVWANNILVEGTARRYMLWGPNRDGDRPWSDTAGGKERLQHCQSALEEGEGEGILIYGERRGGDLPIQEASKVSGADPHTVLRFKVHKKGDEYWAVWGPQAGSMP